ncbi:hypothetical protein ACWCL1_08130 [Ligilactobacillus sp. LYQ135]
MKKRNLNTYMPILVILLAATVFILNGRNPLINYRNSDLVFHINRMIGLDNVLTHPINFKTFNQIGYGINYFYPWLTLYPVVILMKLFHSVTFGYVAFLYCLNVVTGLIAYYAGKQIYTHRSELKSTVFAVLYMFLNYRILNVYRRFDIGELIAMAFVPLVISALYSILIKNEKHGIQLAIGMTLILYSHLLTAILMLVVCIIMTIACVTRIVDVKKSVVEVLKAAFLSMMLSLGFILPYLQQARLGIASPFLGNLENSAFPVSELINNSLNNTLGNSQITVANLGLICIVFLFIGLVNLNKTKDQQLFFILGLIFAILTTKLFPWRLINDSVALLQFPWRFMTFAGVFLLLYGVSITLDAKRYKFIAPFLVVLAIGLQLSSVVALKSTAKSENFISENKIGQLLNWNNLDYFPKESEKMANTISNHEFYANNKKINIKYKVNDDKMTITVPKQADGKDLNIPVVYYAGTKVFNSSNQELKVYRSNRGTLELKNVNSGEITITSEYSTLARIGQIISLITLLGIVGYEAFRKK